MNRTAALVHSQPEFSSALADAVARSDLTWTVDDLSERSRRERIQRLFTGDYDVIQADETLGNGVLAAVASTVTRTPFVVCLRGWGDMMNAHGQYGRLHEASIRIRSKAVLRAATRTLTLGEQTQRELEAWYGTGLEDAQAAPRPLDIDAFQPSQRVTTDGAEATELLTVTNLRYAEKLAGVETILEGLTPLLAQRPALTYSIAGGGRHLDALQRTVADHPHADQIKVLEFRDDVPELLAAADVFVYASYLDAYPTVILEAQATGLPVVACDASSVPDVVADAGRVCDTDPEAVEAAVREVLDDAALRASLAEKSRERMTVYNADAAEYYVDVWNSITG